jgi:hypothetical protein
MIEQKLAIWALGFAIGVMTVIAGDKLLEKTRRSLTVNRPGPTN